MNKQDLIDVIASSADLPKAAAARALEAVTGTISKTLSQGEQVVLIGFGTFDVAQRAARTGRNPQSGQPIQIPASRVVRFKAGKALKDEINKD